jgi:DNA invertase Pin-like site-specific DNA recombinase
MMIAAYLRTSTEQQDTNNQRDALRKYAQSRGWLIAHWYVDVESGGSSERRYLRELLAAVKRRSYSRVLITSLDRLTREGPAQTFRYLATFAQYGCTVVSVAENWLEEQTDPDLAELQIAVTSVWARMERKRISARTKQGIERARKEGKQLGRPRCIVDAVRLRDRISAGESIAAIARELGVSRRTLARRISSTPA